VSADTSGTPALSRRGQADRVTLVNLDVIGGILEDVPGRADDNIETSFASSPDPTHSLLALPRIRPGTAAPLWPATRVLLPPVGR
jgi:hypothetical protein